MKTAEEYAIELIMRFYDYFPLDLPQSKQCAIMVVGELIKAANEGYDYDATSELPYYDDVIKKIVNYE